MEQAKDYANTISRRVGFAVGALIMAITVFAVGGWPAAHWWLMVVSVGLASHAVAYAVIFTINGRPYVPVVWADDPEPQPVPPPENKQVVLAHARPQETEPEPEIPSPLSLVVAMVEDRFIQSTKWAELANYLQDEVEPVFSRGGLLPYVEQRFYSRPPGQIYTTFPELMIRLRLARPDGDSYQWRDVEYAASTIAALAAQVKNFYPTLPDPVTKNNRNGGYNHSYERNHAVTGGRGVLNEVEYE